MKGNRVFAGMRRKSENRNHPEAIRPIGNRDVLVNEEGMDLEIEVESNQKTNEEKLRKDVSNQERSRPSQEDEEGNEGRAIKGQKRINLPSKEEWDNHMRSHIPFSDGARSVSKAGANQGHTYRHRNRRKTWRKRSRKSR